MSTEVKRLPDAQEIPCPHCGSYAGFRIKTYKPIPGDPCHEWVYSSCRACGGPTVQRRRKADKKRVKYVYRRE